VTCPACARATMVPVTTPDERTTPEPAEPVAQGRPGTVVAPADVDPVRTRLTFFKVMAFVVGVGLLLLVVEMVLAYGFGLKGDQNPLHWWPQPHGFIYMVYLVATALLGFKVGWSLTRMVLVMLAGCVPFLSFWVERRVATEVEAGLAAARQ
jgi:integral membrane protein